MTNLAVKRGTEVEGKKRNDIDVFVLNGKINLGGGQKNYFENEIKIKIKISNVRDQNKNNLKPLKKKKKKNWMYFSKEKYSI
jgi:hypothetical protein